MDDKTPCSTFHLEEYKSLRAEIAADDADIRRLERLCATGCAAVWFWLFGKNDEAWSILAFIPVLIALFGWARTSALYTGMFNVAEYLRQIEVQYACSPLPGWETFLDAKRRKMRPSELTMLRSTHVFWCVLTVVALGLALLYVFVLH